jgi:hypothetical protein
MPKPKPEHLGQAALTGWRAKVGDAAARAVAPRAPLSEDQVRALVGVTFFALSVMYVVKTTRQIAELVRS